MTTLPTRLDLFKLLPLGTEGVEVGVLRGDFSAEILSTPVRRLHLVDCWKHLDNNIPFVHNPDEGGHETNYRHVMNRFHQQRGTGRVNVIRAMSKDAVQEFNDRSLDWVYLDGDHSYDAVVQDLVWWSTKIKTGGCLMGHDYTESPEARRLGFGVVRAVSGFVNLWPESWKLTHVTSEEWPSFCLKRV